MSALVYLGRDPNSENAEDLAAAEALLSACARTSATSTLSSTSNDLASGEVCVSLSWNGQIVSRRKRVGAAPRSRSRSHTRTRRRARHSGSTQSAIPADAPHPGNAHVFLNFLMEPEVIAAISKEIGYANGNAAARAIMDKSELTDDPSDVSARRNGRVKLQPIKTHTQAYSRELNRAWTRIKTGQ